jgi:hypothetical protein
MAFLVRTEDQKLSDVTPTQISSVLFCELTKSLSKLEVVAMNYLFKVRAWLH